MRKKNLHKLIKKANTEEMKLLAQMWIESNVKDNKLYGELMVELSQNEAK